MFQLNYLQINHQRREEGENVRQQEISLPIGQPHPGYFWRVKIALPISTKLCLSDGKRPQQSVVRGCSRSSKSAPIGTPKNQRKHRRERQQTI